MSPDIIDPDDVSNRDKDFEDLFDAITGHVCRTREDIGAITGWGVNKVSTVLALIRRPEIAAEEGWTVPHVPRGHGEHLYQVILTNGGQHLDEEEQAAIRAGAVSTLRLVATESENQAHALRETARYGGLTPTQGRRLRRLAATQEACAAMARDIEEVVLNGTT
jgi:hypothetical protein